LTNENYQLSISVFITWTQAKVLRKALRKAYWCLFVTKIKDKLSILSLPIRRWNAAPSYGHMNEAMSTSTPTLHPALKEAKSKF